MNLVMNRPGAEIMYMWATTWQNQQNECAPSEDLISLGIHPVWSESSLCTQWVAKDPSFLHADSEDSDQTGRMPRLIWVFAVRTVTLLVLPCHGSCTCMKKSAGGQTYPYPKYEKLSSWSFHASTINYRILSMIWIPSLGNGLPWNKFQKARSYNKGILYTVPLYLIANTIM